MKRTVLALLCSVSLAACAQSSPGSGDGQKIVVGNATAAGSAAAAEPKLDPGSPEANARAVLERLNPRIRVESVSAAPIAGFRQMVAGGQVVYVSDDGKYMLQGTLLDIANRKDLSEEAMVGVRREILKTLPMADRIVFAPTSAPKHKVVVLTDIDCGFCRKFHSDIAEYTKRGIQIEYLAFPRAGLGSPDYRQMVSVWCSADRRKALTDAKNGHPVPSRTCTTPVDMQYYAGIRMGLVGTPMLLTEDGRSISGYLPPDALLTQLEAMEETAPQAAGGA